MVRRVILIATVSAVVAAAVMTAVQATESTQRLAYSAVPGHCELLTAATLDAYLPGSMMSSQSDSPCAWTSVSGVTERQLLVTLRLFNSSDAITEAQHFFAGFGGLSNGVTIARRAVPELGDQATAVTSVTGGLPARLVVRSSNLDISVSYTEGGEGDASALITDDVAITRDILRVLAHAASAAAVAPLPTGPDYATAAANACSLVGEPTLVAHLPGATDLTQPYRRLWSPSGSRSGGCEWVTPGLTSLTLAVNVSRSPEPIIDALQNYESAVATDERNADGGTRPVRGLGDRATAVIGVKTGTSSAGTDLFVWSGNAEIELDFSTIAESSPGVPTPPNEADQRAALIAVAHNVLATLAHPGAASPPQAGSATAWPRYRLPLHSCPLVSAATLADYMPDATVDQSADSPSAPVDGMQKTACVWRTQASLLAVWIGLYSGVSGLAGAQQEFESDLLADRSPAGEMITGTSQVRGVGNLATSITESDAKSQTVILLVWSGDTVIEVDYHVGTRTDVAARVSAAKSVASDVLTHLPA
jgi:hypothetical protein